MSDLIGQVDYERSTCPACGDPDCHFPPACQAVVYDDADGQAVRAAATEIERLRAEIERLRKALTEIAQSEGEDWDVCTLGCWWTAEQALKGDDR